MAMVMQKYAYNPQNAITEYLLIHPVRKKLASDLRCRCISFKWDSCKDLNFSM